jgi:hypothetical protein
MLLWALHIHYTKFNNIVYRYREVRTSRLYKGWQYCFTLVEQQVPTVIRVTVALQHTA